MSNQSGAHSPASPGIAATHVDKTSPVRRAKRNKARRWLINNGHPDIAEMLGLFDPYEEG